VSTADIPLGGPAAERVWLWGRTNTAGEKLLAGRVASHYPQEEHRLDAGPAGDPGEAPTPIAEKDICHIYRRHNHLL
jgi:hypothetical protein